MSGIYIQGVTVPEDNTLLLRIFPEIDGIYYTEQLDIDEDILDKYFAVPVPDHGRLIDADSKTFPTPHRNPSNDYTKGWNACLRSVQQQPTIIPASNGEPE